VYKQVDIASPSTPVLQGCRSKSGLWGEINLQDKERQSEKKGHEEGTANNVYSLPAIKTAFDIYMRPQDIQQKTCGSLQ